MSTIKVSVKELKEVINWMETNTNNEYINIEIEKSTLSTSCFDKFDQQVEIVLYSKEAALMPKIRKTDIFLIKK